MENSSIQYVINPMTNRRVKVGSAIYNRLIKQGALHGATNQEPQELVTVERKDPMKKTVISSRLKKQKKDTNEKDSDDDSDIDLSQLKALTLSDEEGNDDEDDDLDDKVNVNVMAELVLKEYRNGKLKVPKGVSVEQFLEDEIIKRLHA